MKRSFSRAMAGLGVCAVLAGCGSSGSDDSSKASTTTAAPEASTTTDASGTEKTTAPPVSTSTKVLASSDTTAGSAALHLDVNALERSGDLMTLTMTIKNNGTDNISLSRVLHVSDSNFRGGVFGVYLVDSVNKKKYLPAMDSQRNCLCTKLIGFPILKPQETGTLTATFGAAPADVKVLDVSVHIFPLISAVPVS